MRFLLDQDYTAIVRNEIKDLLLEDYTETKLFTAENMAIAQIKNNLFGHYDTDLIFQLWEDMDQPDPRNAYVVMITLDCTLYHLYTSLAPERIPKLRSDRYQDVLNWLKEVTIGKKTADLPRITDISGTEQIGFVINSEYDNEDNRW
ncbi:phage protein Gp36 family protein [Aquimarina latercula]|uniref:phage protein Gp36 family protein n=1 Tax=Aquimarina latercula TaxID=987 RepID=UPI00040677F9|nr:phage protein Gp36 family protein [Aquimarina latercula]